MVKLKLFLTIILSFCSTSEIFAQSQLQSISINFEVSDNPEAVLRAEATNLYVAQGITFPSRPTIVRSRNVNTSDFGDQSLAQGSGVRCAPLEIRFNPSMDVRALSFDVINRHLRYYYVEAYSGDLLIDEHRNNPQNGQPPLTLHKSVTLRAGAADGGITKVIFHPPSNCFDLAVIDNLTITANNLINPADPIPPRVSGYEAIEIRPNIKWSGRLNDVSINPRNPLDVYVTSERGGLWHTSNGGETWRVVTSLPVFELNSVHHVTADPNVIIVTAMLDFQRIPIAGRNLITSGGGIWISYDRGRTWSQPIEAIPRYASGTSSGRDAACPAIGEAFEISEDPDTGRIFIGTGCGISFVDNVTNVAAASWTHKTGLGSSNWIDSRSFKSVAAFRGSVVIASNGENVFRSANNGIDWLPVNISPGVPMQPSIDLHAITAIPDRDNSGFIVTRTAGDDSTRKLYYTPDGVNWQEITDLPSGSGGGMAHIYALPIRSFFRRNRINLYFGNTLQTYKGSFDLRRPGRTVNWTLEEASHLDSRALGFKTSGTRRARSEPIFLASDGGLDRKTRVGANTLWSPIGSGRNGINALQLFGVTGQNLTDTGGYRLAFGTMDNNLWSSSDEVNWPESQMKQWEGGGIQMSRRVTSASDDTWSYLACAACGLNLSDPLFQDAKLWPGYALKGPGWRFDYAKKLHAYSDTGAYAHRYYKIIADGPNQNFLGVTLNYGQNYQEIEIEPVNELRGYPHPTNGSSFYQAYSKGTTYEDEFQEQDRNVSRTHLRFYPINIARASNPLMNGFGSIGFTGFGFELNFVYGVNPLDPDHIIASDSENRDVMVTRDGGENWSTIPDLKAILTGDSKMTMAIPKLFKYPHSLVSVISFFPENPDLLLLGMNMGGAYLSQDGGENWTHVIGSAQIPNILNFEWKSGDEIYVASYGRGLWKFKKTWRRLEVLSLQAHLEDPAQDTPLLRNIDFRDIWVVPTQDASTPERTAISVINDNLPLSLKAALRSNSFDQVLIAVGGKILGIQSGKDIETQIKTTSGATIYRFDHKAFGPSTSINTIDSMPASILDLGLSKKVQNRLLNLHKRNLNNRNPSTADGVSEEILGTGGNELYRALADVEARINKPVGKPALVVVGLLLKDGRITAKLVGPQLHHKRQTALPKKHSRTLNPPIKPKEPFVIVESNKDGVFFGNKIVEVEKTVKVIGKNFAVNLPAVIKINDETTARTTSDSKGSIFKEIGIPNLGPGFHRLEIIQKLRNGKNISLTTEFMVRHSDK